MLAQSLKRENALTVSGPLSISRRAAAGFLPGPSIFHNPAVRAARAVTGAR